MPSIWQKNHKGSGVFWNTVSYLLREQIASSWRTFIVVAALNIVQAFKSYLSTIKKPSWTSTNHLVHVVTPIELLYYLVLEEECRLPQTDRASAFVSQKIISPHMERDVFLGVSRTPFQGEGPQIRKRFGTHVYAAHAVAYGTQQPNFAWWSNKMKGIFWSVDQATSPGQNFCDKNTNTRSVCGSHYYLSRRRSTAARI